MLLTPPAIALLVINLCLIWLLLAAPLGLRTITIRRSFADAPARIWHMNHPLGEHVAWSQEILSSTTGSGEGEVVQTLGHLDKAGRNVVRILSVRSIEEGDAGRCELTVKEDTALDRSFWRHYREAREVRAAGNGTELLIEVTDRYRGLAFFLFRYFRLLRETRQMRSWLENGTVTTQSSLETWIVQVCLALISTLLLWPFLGLTRTGLILSSMVTTVIVLHELGHMAAYRAFGHKSVRMIFIPMLGGIAMGGRPYRSLFEVASCALLGAGFSAFLVPIVIFLHRAGHSTGLLEPLQPALLTFLLILGAFNFLNLLPMSRFDGGQVLKQVFRTQDGLLGATFLVTAGMLWTGWRIGIPEQALLGGMAVMALMSFASGKSIKPREALEDMSAIERLEVGFGYYAVLAIHANALIYAADRLMS